LIKVGDTDGPVAHPIYQMPADSLRQIAPRLDSWASAAKHHPAHLIALALDFLRIGGASETPGEVRELLLLPLFRSMPVSINSSSIRLALSLRALAKLRTWVATFAGKVMLCRTALFAILITPSTVRSARRHGRNSDDATPALGGNPSPTSAVADYTLT
jgi:hypothetical protein